MSRRVWKLAIDRTTRPPFGAGAQCVTMRADRRHRRDQIGSAVEHRPADFVAQPLIVKYKLANRIRKLVPLPLALTTPRGLAPVRVRGSTGGFDRVGGSTKLMRGDVRNSPSLARSVSGMPGRPAQVSGRTHGMTARSPSLHHLHLSTCPSAGMFDRLARPWILRLSRLEKVKDVLRARCRPNGEQMVIRIREGPTPASRHEAKISHFREDHGGHFHLSTR